MVPGTAPKFVVFGVAPGVPSGEVSAPPVDIGVVVPQAELVLFVIPVEVVDVGSFAPYPVPPEVVVWAMARAEVRARAGIKAAKV